MKRKKMSKKNKKKAINIAIIAIIAMLLFSGIIYVGFFMPLVTETTFIDTTDEPTASTWVLCGSGTDQAMVAQEITIPTGVVYLRRGGFKGVTRHEWGCSCYADCGLSSVLSTDTNDWLTVEHNSIGSVGVNFEIDYDVASGEKYYLMFKPVSSGDCGCMDYTPCSGSAYDGGNLWTDMYYGYLHESGFDAKFWLQGIINYGITFEVISAGAYPDHIPSGGSTTIQWSIRSTTGGTCNIVVYGNGGTQVWHSEAQTFAQGETKTGSYAKSGITGTPGSYMRVKVQVEIGGEEEAHKWFNIWFTEETQHPPSAPILGGSSTLDAGQAGNWNALSYDTDGNNMRYIWQADGSTVRTSGYLSGGVTDSLSHTFSTAGSHTIKVKAEDTTGQSSSWATKTVIVEAAEPGKYQALISVADSTTYGAIGGASVICNGESKTANTQGVATYTLPVGTYTATASASGYVSNSVSITVTTSGGSASVYLDTTENGEEPEEPEEGFYAVTVEVFDDITNLPVENAKVTANNVDKFTNSEGEAIYSLEGSGKTYSISIIASGYNSDLKTTTVYDGPKTVSFYLVPYGNGEEPGLDSDGDGWVDSEEIDAGSDPYDAASTPLTVAPAFLGLEWHWLVAIAVVALIVAIGIAFIYIRRKKK